MSSKSNQVSFRVGRDLETRLLEEGKKRGLSISQMCRLTIEAGLAAITNSDIQLAVTKASHHEATLKAYATILHQVNQVVNKMRAASGG